MAKYLLQLLDKPDSLIIFVKDRPGHDLRYAINHKKITTTLNWKPKIDLKKGLELTVEWYQNNTEWLNKVINKEYSKYYEKHYRNR